MQVEDFSDLSKVSTEKLLKLRDVAEDNEHRLRVELTDAGHRVRLIREELGARKNAKEII